MTIEAKYKLFGVIPVATEEMFPLDRERFIEIKIEGKIRELKYSARTVRVLNTNEIVIFPYTQAGGNLLLTKGVGIVLSQDNINKAQVRLFQPDIKGRRIPFLSADVQWR